MTRYLTLDDLCRLAARLRDQEPGDVRNVLACGVGERILMAPTTVPSPFPQPREVDQATLRDLGARVATLMHRILVERPLFQDNEDLAWLCGIEFAERNGCVFAPTANSQDVALLIGALQDGLTDAALELVRAHLVPSEHRVRRRAA